MASLLSFTSRFYKNDSYAEFLEVNDTELFGVGVRIYKPVNKTKKHIQEMNLINKICCQV